MSKIVGQKYGTLKILEAWTDRSAGGHPKQMVRVECDCGRVYEKLRKGLNRSKHPTCRACYKPQQPKEFGQQHPLYRTWRNMRDRCTLPKAAYYELYGGRGITVCDRWMKSFEAFVEDMGDKPSTRHTLDRVDNDGPYSPENCRWATHAEQQGNRRDCILVTLGEHTKPVNQWAKTLGLKNSALYESIKAGKRTPEEVLLDAIAKQLTTD